MFHLRFVDHTFDQKNLEAVSIDPERSGKSNVTLFALKQKMNLCESFGKNTARVHFNAKIVPPFVEKTRIVIRIPIRRTLLVHISERMMFCQTQKRRLLQTLESVMSIQRKALGLRSIRYRMLSRHVEDAKWFHSLTRI